MKNLVYILILIFSLPSYSQDNQEMEKEKIYSTIKALDDWYKIAYVHYWDITDKWYIEGTNSSIIKEQFKVEDYSKYAEERIVGIDKLQILSDELYNILIQRLKNREDILFNEAMVLTNHEFGNMFNSFLVKRVHMDGIPAFWPEYNIFMNMNQSMSDSAYIEWHKERISIIDNKAVYKVFYGEVGDSQSSNPNGHGDYQILKIILTKDNCSWKIIDFLVEEQSQEQATLFYNENVKRRGYFDK